MEKLFYQTVKDTQKYIINGRSGLQNLGNTCYLNSIIQCLRHNKYLVEYFCNDSYSTHLKKNEKCYFIITEAWKDLLKVLWSDNNIIIQPKAFLLHFQMVARIKKRYEFIGPQQNDSGECLQFLLDMFHESIKIKIQQSNTEIKGTVKNNFDKLELEFYKYYSTYLEKNGISPISKVYEGFYCSSLVNNHNDNVSNTFEPFVYIDLTISDKTDTLSNCLSKFTEKEKLDDYRPENYPEDAIFYKKINFLKLPKDLIIIFKRFENTSRKKETYIKYPFKLNMKPFCSGYASRKDHIYDLYGVVIHNGSLNGGHYYTHVKNFSNKWTCYNDHRCYTVDEPEDVITKDAYILFYRLQSTE